MDEAVKQNVDLELEESSAKMRQLEGFLGLCYRGHTFYSRLCLRG